MVDLALEQISVFGLPPVQFVELAADLGCRHITTSLRPSGAYNPHGYAKYCLREDKALRREMIAAMRDRGISPSLADGIAILQNIDARSTYAADLDLLKELGVARINVVSLDPDVHRTFDQLSVIVEMAASVGIATVVEFVPIFTIADLATAVAAVRHVGRKDCSVLFDTMHFGRSAAPLGDIAALDPNLIGYIQLCDAKLVPVTPNYLEEAMYDRLVPGEGELPLGEMLAALPRELIVGLEVPMRGEAEAGVGPRERMGRCVAAARVLLAQLPKVANSGVSTAN
jgi:sugar phosphate isomerase/epimerase